MCHERAVSKINVEGPTDYSLTEFFKLGYILQSQMCFKFTELVVAFGNIDS